MTRDGGIPTGYKIIESEHVYSGEIISLRKDLVRYPSGYEGEREVITHPGAAGVIAFTESGLIPLVRQYRHATGESIIEIPAGLLHPGEDPMACAIRELKEEVGASAEALRYLGWFYTTPGACSERLHLYYADRVRLGDSAPEEGEEFEHLMVGIGEALDMIDGGEIVDSKTVIAVLRAARLRGV